MQNLWYIHERVFLVAVEALPFRRPMNDNMHLVMFTIHRLIATFATPEPAALIRIQRDIQSNAVKKHLPCTHRSIAAPLQQEAQLLQGVADHANVNVIPYLLS